MTLVSTRSNSLGNTFAFRDYAITDDSTQRHQTIFAVASRRTVTGRRVIVMENQPNACDSYRGKVVLVCFSNRPRGHVN